MTGAVAAPTVPTLLREGMAVLQASGPAAARREAEWLLAGVLGVGRFDVYLEPARELSTDEARRYLALLRRRAAGEPLQHLLGFEEFYGLRVAVSPAVLIPRPETEGLVQWAIEILGAKAKADALVADVGTGSGAIACALAARVPGLRVLALDCSPAALAVAADNVRAHGLEDRVQLAVGDLLATPVTGAYGHSMASNYNKLTRPAVVFVRDGDARLVVRRETYDDLLRCEVL